MAKKRKTRQQKMVTATRRTEAIKHDTLPHQSITYTLPSHHSPHMTSTISTSRAHATHAAHAYDYVTHDLRKTAFITSSIILAQLILFFILNSIR